MTGVTIVETSRLGVEPSCEACSAGAVMSFNWAFAHERGASEDVERAAPFTLREVLRRGSLYRCSVCNEVWHLDGQDQTMTHVGPARLLLVLQWDREPIELVESLKARLARIGPTPPDVYGNASDMRVTPCKVIMITGEAVDPAMVCVQLDAPVQGHMHFRLGTEIADLEDSALALPLDVRLASSRAWEMRMGFSPSLIEMSDGRKFVLNGMTSFMDEPGYSAADARVATGSYFAEEPPPPFLQSPVVTYFVVDGEPGWVRDLEPSRLWPTRKPAWLRRLFKR